MSTSVATAPVSKAASKVKARVGRTRVEAGTRVAVTAKVKVADRVTATGKVRVVVDGKVVRTVKVKRGKADHLDVVPARTAWSSAPRFARGRAVGLAEAGRQRHLIAAQEAGAPGASCPARIPEPQVQDRTGAVPVRGTDRLWSVR